MPGGSFSGPPEPPISFSMLGTGGAFHGNVVVLVMWVPFRQGPAIIESVAHCRIRTRQWTMFAALLLPTQSSALIEFWLSSLAWCQRAAAVPTCFRVPPAGNFWSCLRHGLWLRTYEEHGFCARFLLKKHRRVNAVNNPALMP